MFGILAILVVAIAVSTFTLPSLAASTMDQLRTSKQLRACDQLMTQDYLQAQDRLQTQDQLKTCTENCTQLQTMEQTQARDGSCGDCNGLCLSGGVQQRKMAESQICLNDCSKARNPNN